ncbi:metallophosphoesterase [Pelagicoccus sp. SDUM812003]|uniref:metallophosphoesterase family protein n=1 Tax=Pelagicoccus sp. SDUM812003 TaxID=3041267 RepID=UPI00280DA9BC|nr:metallophosphoesterase [Pelagicoccus sp. SDUM812003]MDQ8201483.1 metallophosphoesterase family protein [Pelagicoccus sp. SDUM812003]
MKVTLISDTHTMHDRLPPLSGDVLVHAGDFYDLAECRDKKLKRLNAWFAKQDFQVKLFVPGDHDIPVFKSWRAGKNYLSEATLLVDSVYEYEGVHFYGSPWVPNADGYAFAMEDERIEETWSKIPLETDVLITHVPPFGALDDGPFDRGLGCRVLRRKVREVRPCCHVYGHIHWSSGYQKLGGTRFVNSSYVNQLRFNEPRVFEITRSFGGRLDASPI